MLVPKEIIYYFPSMPPQKIGDNCLSEDLQKIYGSEQIVEIWIEN